MEPMNPATADHSQAGLRCCFQEFHAVFSADFEDGEPYA
jgi:hypothetical protein